MGLMGLECACMSCACIAILYTRARTRVLTPEIMGKLHDRGRCNSLVQRQ